MATLDVVAVGELNPDLILDGMDGLPLLGREILAGRATFTLGGSTALCAANLAALGLKVGIVGKMGDDPFGDFVIRSLRAGARLAGRPIRECLQWGNTCGALTAGRPGGSGAITSRADVEAFLRRQERI